MPARAMFKAEITLEDLRVPVKLYAAVQDARIHFRLLHAKDHTPVAQQMVDPETQEPVPPEEIKRAVEVERGIFVAVTRDEQAQLEPKASRSITVDRIVTADKLEERWFDRPYYLGPDGDDDSYFAFAAVLEAKRWIAIVHWVMRKRSYAGALYGSDGYLLLDTLRNATDLVEIKAVRTPPSRAPEPREIALAEQLIGALEDRFDASEFRDEYQEQLKALLAAKAAGKIVRFPKAPKREKAASLVASLQASLKASRKEASHGRRP
jgi:DNA end-binding protein Ku